MVEENEKVLDISCTTEIRKYVGDFTKIDKLSELIVDEVKKADIHKFGYTIDNGDSFISFSFMENTESGNIESHFKDSEHGLNSDYFFNPGSGACCVTEFQGGDDLVSWYDSLFATIFYKFVSLQADKSGGRHLNLCQSTKK